MRGPARYRRHRHPRRARRLSGADAAHRAEHGGNREHLADQQHRRFRQSDAGARRLDPAVQLAPQHQQRPGRHQRAQPAQFRRDPHAHPAQRPALGRLDDHRRGRRQHDPANARRAGRDRHRRRFGLLWFGRGRRRGQLHPRQRLRGPADRGGHRHHRRGATGSIIPSAPPAACPSRTAAAVSWSAARSRISDGIFDTNDRDWNQTGFVRIQDPTWTFASTNPQFITTLLQVGAANSTPGGLITELGRRRRQPVARHLFRRRRPGAPISIRRADLPVADRQRPPRP